MVTPYKLPCRGNRSVVHNDFSLYNRPCTQCRFFCNCMYWYFSRSYPDAWVRSLDKQIVRLSGELVRASPVLWKMADEVLKNGSESDWLSLPTEGMQDDKNKLKDLVEFPPRKSIILCDDKGTPTLGIKKDTLEKLNYFTWMHLDDVDMKISAERRHEEHWNNVLPKKWKHLNMVEDHHVNTFAYEDWEEEFFSVDDGKFFELQQASVELQLNDLHWALEKWIVLFRGYPRLMVNGHYEILEDPDFDDFDAEYNFFGMWGIPYYNDRKRSRHRSGDYQFIFRLTGPPLVNKNVECKRKPTYKEQVKKFLYS